MDTIRQKALFRKREYYKIINNVLNSVRNPKKRYSICCLFDAATKPYWSVLLNCTVFLHIDAVIDSISMYLINNANYSSKMHYYALPESVSKIF